MKKQIGLIAAILLGISISSFASADVEKNNRINLLIGSNVALINQKEVKINAEDGNTVPFIENDITMVPLRFVAESMQAKVDWDNSTKGITITKNNDTIHMTIGNKTITVNQVPVDVATAPFLQDNSTFVPLRVIMEAMKQNVDYQNGVIQISDQKLFLNLNDVTAITNELQKGRAYLVFQNENFLKGFASYEDAQVYAKRWAHGTVRDRNGNWLWDNYPAYRVYQGKTLLQYFDRLQDAVAYAKRWSDSKVIDKTTASQTIWSSHMDDTVMLDIPHILQMPELPRGCEVTSLAMILQYAGINVDKMELAQHIKRDPTDKTIIDGEVYFGNPNTGFVGDMYSFDKPGYGVYHGPVFQLASQYTKRAVDVTGSSFDDVLNFLDHGMPVWTITNVTFDELSDKDWQAWHTPTGDIDVTQLEHSVVLQGYDEYYVYIGDPLGQQDKIWKESFQKSWEQMGKQAIVILPH